MEIADTGGNEAWRAPLAGGVAEREAPAPWTMTMPAPSRGWRVAFDHADAHVLPPGANLDDPAAVVLRDVDQMVWEGDGSSITYVASHRMHRMRTASREDRKLFVVRSDAYWRGRWLSVSPDGDTISFINSFGTLYAELITNLADRTRSP